MRNLLSLLAVLTFGSWSASSALASNLVANGGFESGNLTGWTAGGNVANQGTDWGVDNTDPHSGTYGAFFGAQGSSITLSQTLATMVGQSYTISFWLDQTVTPNGPYHNSFSAMFGSNSLKSLTDASAEPYTDYTFTETATSSSTVLKFSFRNDAGFWDIDDITASAGRAVPEPASLLLIAPGLAALYFLRKRRTA